MSVFISDTERRDLEKMKVKTGGRQPQAKDPLEPPTGSGRKDSSLRLVREHSPASSLILDF